MPNAISSWPLSAEGVQQLSGHTILALEASGPTATVALGCQGRILVARSDLEVPASQILLPLAAELLQVAGLEPRALDAIAFGSGPGSFTGLRLACGLAQGMALALRLPLLPVDTLLAQTVGLDAQRVISTLDARMGQIYLGIYAHCESRYRTLWAPSLCAAATLPDLPDDTPEPWLVAGSGIGVLERELQSRWPSARLAWKKETMPTAGQVLQVALGELVAGRGVTAEQAQPLYVRDKVAQTRTERAGCEHGRRV